MICSPWVYTNNTVQSCSRRIVVLGNRAGWLMTMIMTMAVTIMMILWTVTAMTMMLMSKHDVYAADDAVGCCFFMDVCKACILFPKKHRHTDEEQYNDKVYTYTNKHQLTGSVRSFLSPFSGFCLCSEISKNVGVRVCMSVYLLDTTEYISLSERLHTAFTLKYYV